MRAHIGINGFGNRCGSGVCTGDPSDLWSVWHTGAAPDSISAYNTQTSGASEQWSIFTSHTFTVTP